MSSQRRSASTGRMLAAQTAMELRLSLRRGESLLVTLVIPPVLLVFLSTLPAVGDALGLPRSGGAGAVAGAVLPGMLALAVMSTSLVSLGIATAFERGYGVLKRLGGSPLPRSLLIVAKLLSVLAVELVQTVLLTGIALALGWQPAGNAPLALLAVLLGTAAFGGLGLWMAGTWRAEATLAGANGLYVLLLLFGGIVASPTSLPGPVSALVSVLPSAALSEALRGSLPGAGVSGEVSVVAWTALIVWAFLAPILAARTFQWE
jgi:ABC-2 type transport system permease protein